MDWRWLCSLVLAVIVSGLVPSTVLAGDVNLVTSFSDFTAQTVTHEDSDPFKGSVALTVTNNGATAWGDFHFQIVSCLGSDVSNVLIMDVDPYKPTTDRSPFTYVVDNVTVGATLDYYFYGDPVAPGESATFSFYTDNTADQVDFCLYMCPSPVPEPAMLGLLAVGGVALLRRR